MEDGRRIAAIFEFGIRNDEGGDKVNLKTGEDRRMIHRSGFRG